MVDSLFITDYVIFAALVFYVCALGLWGMVRLTTLLTYFQQVEYNRMHFLRCVLTGRFYDVRATCVCVLSALLIAVLGFAVPAVVAFVYGVAGVCTLLIARVEQRYIFKKPLVRTERLCRVRALTIVCAGVLLLVVVGSMVWLHTIAPAVLFLQGLPLCIGVADYAFVPYQQRVNNALVARAVAKLRALDPTVIGITGSFGKTTVKHILAALLNAEAPVFYSRGSINTMLGLTRHVRERLQAAHRYCLVEMGAYGVGSIDRLCHFARPQWAIITAIGHAHAMRFGNLHTTAQAKSELAQWVCQNGQASIVSEQVMQYTPFPELKARYPNKIITVGENADNDVVITDSLCDDRGCTVTLRLQHPLWYKPVAPDTHTKHTDISLHVPLLGGHNVINTALVMALLCALVPPIQQRLPHLGALVDCVPHRLDVIETAGQPLILDDAYNANEQGFITALDTLALLAQKRGGRAILVTPGLIELGAAHNTVHNQLGQHCQGKADIVYVINRQRIPHFVDGINRPRKIRNANGSETLMPIPHVICADSLRDARAQIQNQRLTEQDVILYANDLPDFLEQKRLL